MAKKKAKRKAEPITKRLSIEEIETHVRKLYGNDSIMTFKEGVVQKVPVISSGSLILDRALGIGGLPRGRQVEILGPESSGKTTVCLATIANAQRAGGVAAFIDSEHALDLAYARALGVDIGNLLLSQPDCGEDALGIVEALLETRSVDVIVVDGVSALVPRAELEGEMGDSHMGLQARLMSQAMRKLVGPVKKANALVIYTNQIRMKIGVSWGSPETTSGGQALKFYASVRMDIRRTASKKNDAEEIIANHVRIKIIKNKMAPPFKIAETTIYFGKGFDYYAEVLDLALIDGVAKKRGAWFSYDGEQLGQGRDAAVELLRENPDIAKKMLVQIDAGPDKEAIEKKIAKMEKKIAKATDPEKKKKYKKILKKNQTIFKGL